ARAEFKEGRISAEQLRAVEDDAIREVTKVQQDAGLRGITDGEQRRTFFHVDFLEKLHGVTATIGDYEIKFRGGNKEVTLSPPVLHVTGKLSRPEGGIAVEDFNFLKSVVAPGLVPKVCIPSPTMLHFRGGRSGIDEKSYPDMEGFFEDLARVYHEEIQDLYDHGCRYIQLDDTNLAYLCDPVHRERVKGLGEDPDKLPSLYARLISDCIKGRPDD